VGLTSDERDRLAGHASVGPPMDLNMSLLAFVCLLLICILILAASLIARSQPGNGGSESGFLPSLVPARAFSPANDQQQNTDRKGTNTDKPAPDVSEESLVSEPNPENPAASDSEKPEE